MKRGQPVDETRGGPNHPDFLPRVVRTTTVHTGKVVNVKIDEITTPHGAVVAREIVEHPGAVVIIAIDEEGRVFLVRQYRHAIGRYLVELPAGGLEPGEEPLAAAQRELREEVGVEASQWTALGSFFSSPGFANELLHAFLAEELRTAQTDPDDDEDIEVLRYPLDGLKDRFQGSLDAKTLAALYLLERLQSGNEPS